MHELGESSQSDHADIGTLASELGIDHLVCVDAPEYASSAENGSHTTIHLCDSKDEASAIARNLNQGDVVLVKASRSEKLEELAQMISAQWSEGMVTE